MLLLSDGRRSAALRIGQILDHVQVRDMKKENGILPLRDALLHLAANNTYVIRRSVAQRGTQLQALDKNAKSLRPRSAQTVPDRGPVLYRDAQRRGDDVTAPGRGVNMAFGFVERDVVEAELVIGLEAQVDLRLDQQEGDVDNPLGERQSSCYLLGKGG